MMKCPRRDRNPTGINEIVCAEAGAFWPFMNFTGVCIVSLFILVVCGCNSTPHPSLGGSSMDFGDMELQKRIRLASEEVRIRTAELKNQRREIESLLSDSSKEELKRVLGEFQRSKMKRKTLESYYNYLQSNLEQLKAEQQILQNFLIADPEGELVQPSM
jgi:hypothetical protein